MQEALLSSRRPFCLPILFGFICFAILPLSAQSPQAGSPLPPPAAGRDHHPKGYSMWLAGGGIKGGQVIGKTDEVGLSIVEDRIGIHDLQATILHCLGFDHTRLTYRHLGRDFRLTDVGGNVVRKMLA